MRVSPETSQEEIEQAASQVWMQPMEFRSKFPTVFDPNSIYWLRPKPASLPADSEPESEPRSGLDEIPHVFTPTFKPFVCTFTRSLSFDDISKPSPLFPSVRRIS
jgi:hypothetical protein